MKKLLLLFAAALVSFVSFADETVFSYTLPAIGSATLDDYKAGMDGDLTATGGTIKFGNTTKFETRAEVDNNPAFKLDGDPSSSNTKYVLLNLSSALAAGDVIAVKGFSTSSSGYVFKLSDTRDAASSVLTEGNCVKSLTTSSYTVTSGDCLAGKTAVYVTRNNTSLYFYSVEITRVTTDPDAPILESIAISGELIAETFYEGAAMDYAGLSVVGTYSNDSTATLTSGITWSINPALAEGTTNYTISAAVGELTATKNVTLTVSAVVLSQIKIEGALLTPAYYTGSTLSLSGLVVNAYYSDNTKVDVTSQATLTADQTTLTETVEVNFSAAFEDKTATKKVIVYVCAQPSSDMDTLLSYAHSSSANEGIAISGTTVFAKVKIHGNNDEVDCIQFKNGYTSDGVYNDNSIVLSVTGGFKAGDEIIISGFFNNTDNTKDAKVTIFTLNEDNTPHVLQTMGQTINGRNAGDPFKCVYTLEADADVLYLGRTGNTGTNVYSITVQRPKPAEEPVYDFAAVISGGSLETPLNIELTEGENGLEGSYSGYFRVGTYSIVFADNSSSAPARAAEDAQTFTLDDNGMYDLAISYDGSSFTVTPTFNGYATAIENTEAQKVEKKMINGQLVIIKNGVEYSVLGARL